MALHRMEKLKSERMAGGDAEEEWVKSVPGLTLALAEPLFRLREPWKEVSASC